MLGLGVRELKLGTEFKTLADVSARQLSYVLSGVHAWLLPSDLLEIGGECDSCLHLFAGQYYLLFFHGVSVHHCLLSCDLF